MGISCAFTLVFFVLPMCFKYFVVKHSNKPDPKYQDFLRVGAAISCNLNPLTNIAAILVRHEDIACCVVQMFPQCIRKRFTQCNRVMSTSPTNVFATHSDQPQLTPNNRLEAVGRRTKTVFKAIKHNKEIQ